MVKYSTIFEAEVYAKDKVFKKISKVFDSQAALKVLTSCKLRSDLITDATKSRNKHYVGSSDYEAHIGNKQEDIQIIGLEPFFAISNVDAKEAVTSGLKLLSPLGGFDRTQTSKEFYKNHLKLLTGMFTEQCG